MLVTEKEARAKWCPLSLGPGARMLGADGEFVAAGPAVNRSMEGAPLALACYGSNCMAWRKENSFERNGRVRTDHEREIGVGNTGRGYCGAFGKPEG